MNYLEMAGVALGLLYLWLEYRASAWLWLVSIAMPAIYLAVYYEAGLYADFGISIYYIIASIYGLYCWMRHRITSQPETESAITHTPRQRYVTLALAFFALWTVIGIVLSRLTDSTVPWADAFTTALSIVAMWMLARKYVEQWLVWLVTDVGCALLYAYKDLWFTAGLYALYGIIAVFGYRQWRRMMTQ